MASDTFDVLVRGSAVRFAVHVQPRASRSEVVGQFGSALKVRLQAPPVDGAANDALISLIAGLLRVQERAVEIVGGQSSRNKTVLVQGTTGAAVRALLDGSQHTR